MKKILVLLMVLGLAGTAFASMAQAADILYFVDHVQGHDAMAGALSRLGAGYNVTTINSSADFATQVATGNYDLGIFMVQNENPAVFHDGITALGTFVAGGGKAIYTDYRMDNTYAPLFGATWTYVTNQDTMTVTEAQLLAGISNPVSLFDPGWSEFSMSLAGTIAATFGDGRGAIVKGTGTYVNGFLTDTFSDYETGVQLYTNEIKALTAPLAPSAWLFGSGLVGLFSLRRMRRS